MVVALRLKSYHLDVMSYSSIVRFFFCFLFSPAEKVCYQATPGRVSEREQMSPQVICAET